MKYFGTDGIRGIVGETINEKLYTKVAKAIVTYYHKHNLTPVLLVGNDTRASSDFLLSKLESVLLKHGISTENLGKCSSPCLAFITKKYNYPLGLMFSASHNSKEYNGLKFFNNRGEKVNDEFEAEFERLMENPRTYPIKYVQRKNVEKLKKGYISHLRSLIKNKNKFIYDCANGGTSDICKQLFPKCEKINCHPNGENINHNAGCTHIEFLRLQCIKKKMIGFAFDGDGDRISIVSETGEIIPGDKILHILSCFFQGKNDTLVGTVYTNTGLEKLLNKRSIKLIRAQVGDKKVYKQMIENNSILGGEDSGHIILKNFSNTGDGVLVSIVIANILKTTGKTLEELLHSYYEHFQARANLKVDQNFTLSATLIKEIKKFEHLGARIIIRPSGTEPVLRVFVEHKNKDFAEKFLKQIEDYIKKTQ